MLHPRHVRHGKFESYIEQWFPSWELKKLLKTVFSKTNKKEKSFPLTLLLFTSVSYLLSPKYPKKTC